MNHSPTTTTRVTAVVVSYRSREVTAAAVASLAPARAQGLLDCVVVDNASGDGTVEHVRAHHPWVSVIANTKNTGFASACNQGIARARSPYVLLLNPDAVLQLPDLLSLLSFMDRNPRAGMTGPAIGSPNCGWHQAGGVPTPLRLLAQALLPGWRPSTRVPIVPGSDPFRTDWLCGAVLMMRTAMLEDVGGLDPRFFLYFEETDLCRRAVARGWELWAVGQSVAQHVGGLSARATGSPLVDGCIAEHYFRSRFRYLAKHYGLLVAGMTEFAELGIITLLSLARRAVGRDIAFYRVRIRAPIWGLPPYRPEVKPQA